MSKKLTLLTLLIIALSTIISTKTYGQTTIEGKVFDAATNDPLIGVNILIKGTVVGTVSDVNGNFTLSASKTPPLTLQVSIVGYVLQEFEINEANTTGLEIKMEEQTILGQEIVISASRVEENILESPVSVEKMDVLAIRETAAPSFYDAIKNLKGIDMNTQSITFSSINTRGFAAYGNTRFVQLIDGIDNQAPGLNFAVGNIVGINDLDLESVELLPGASSALYGPNAINGILLMKSKSPFEYQGLSAYAKLGLNHISDENFDPQPYTDFGLRFAKSINNKFAFKITASYLKASDFVGTDYRDQSDLVERGENERSLGNRIYDGVNVYGEPLVNLGVTAAGVPALAPVATLFPTGAEGNFTPNGYKEIDFVDNNTESIKFGGALHYRLTDNIEIFGQYNYGSGSTVYTANDRFVLDDFSIWTAKLELRGSNFYIRGYTTQENAGSSYAANTIASLINADTFIPAYLETFAGARAQGLTIDQSHAASRAAGIAAQPTVGSTTFNQMFNNLREIPISEGGAKFVDQSDLFHYEGMYNFTDKISFAEVIIGGNYRKYSLNSEGTIFALQDDGSEVSISEWGGYVQASRALFDDKFKISGSLRYDKNENFQGYVSPRLSGVLTVKNNHNFRASYQRGFRMPTLQDQYIDLDVVTRRLVGSSQLLRDRYNLETNTGYSTQSVNAARAADDIGQMEAIVLDEFKTEKVNTYEFGYKSLIGNKLFIDAYYYYSSYKDFISEIEFYQAIPNGLGQPNDIDPGSDENKTRIKDETVALQIIGQDVNAKGTVDAHGWAIGMEYALTKGFRIGGNVAYNELLDQQDLLDQNFRADYNTPKWRYNVNFSNRQLSDHFGFHVNWRWQEAFLWQGSFGDGVIPAFGILDAQVSYKIPSLKSIIKLGGTNILNDPYITGFGNPAQGAIYYVSITFDEFLN